MLFRSGFSLPVSFLRSRFGFPRSLRFASSFPLRFRAALRLLLLRFPAHPSAFASGFARSALPFGFRLRSSLRILPFQVSCALSFFASFPFGFFASRFLPSLSLRFSAFAPLRFLLPLPLCFRFASRFAFRFPAVFFILFSSRFYPIPENDTSSRRLTVNRPLRFLLRGLFRLFGFCSFELLTAFAAIDLE